MSKIFTEENKRILSSWARSFVSASLAVYMAGNTDVKAILGAGVAAVLPVIIRWLNPNDHAFGKSE